MKLSPLTRSTRRGRDSQTDAAASTPAPEEPAPGRNRPEPQAGAERTAASPAAAVQRIVDEGRVTARFDPVVALSTREVRGASLVAGFGDLRPADLWLREARSAGAHMALETAVVDRVLEDLHRLPPAEQLFMALSPEAAASQHVRRNLIGALSSRLILEVRPAAGWTDDVATSVGALGHARSVGMSLMIDISGVEMRELVRVAALRPDVLKLVVPEEPGEPERAMISAAVGLASAIGAELLVDGIGTESAVRTLDGDGVTLGQGAIFAGLAAWAAPEPADDGAPESDAGTGAARGNPQAAAALGPAASKLLHRLNRRSGRTLSDVIDAATTALAKHVTGSSVYIAHLDHAMDAFRVIDSASPSGSFMRPGTVVPLDQSLCWHMAHDRTPRLCNSLDEEPSYASIEPSWGVDARSYAGVPIEIADGTRLGSVAAVSAVAGAYGDEVVEIIEAVAGFIAQALGSELGDEMSHDHAEALRELSRTDPMTGALNAVTFSETVSTEWRKRRSLTYMVDVRITNLSQIQSELGQTVRDLVVRDAARAIQEAAGETDVIGRTSGGQFGVVLSGCREETTAAAYCQRLARRWDATVTKRTPSASLVTRVMPLVAAESADEAFEHICGGREAAANALSQPPDPGR